MHVPAHAHTGVRADRILHNYTQALFVLYSSNVRSLTQDTKHSSILEPFVNEDVVHFNFAQKFTIAYI